MLCVQEPPIVSTVICYTVLCSEFYDLMMILTSNNFNNRITKDELHYGAICMLERD